MKINGNFFYFILSAILISIIVLLINNVRIKYKEKFEEEYSQLKIEYEAINNILINNLTNANTNIGFEFNDDLILEDTANNKERLLNIINGKNTLIYRVSDTHCSTCDVAGLISLLKNNSKIPYNSIIIIGSVYNTQLLKSYITENSVKHRIYNLKQNINIKAETFDFPYFLVINENLKVLSCFFPEKSKPNLTDDYFSGIKHLFENNK
jgi:hypothetical protein